jgi:hypothetical protein
LANSSSTSTMPSSPAWKPSARRTGSSPFSATMTRSSSVPLAARSYSCDPAPGRGRRWVLCLYRALPCSRPLRPPGAAEAAGREFFMSTASPRPRQGGSPRTPGLRPGGPRPGVRRSVLLQRRRPR